MPMAVCEFNTLSDVKIESEQMKAVMIFEQSENN